MGGDVSVSMPVRAFLDSDIPPWCPLTKWRRVSMPVRAFLDSDRFRVCHGDFRTDVRFNARQGIS